ncbi:hypothetical protein MRX96_029926 [Rhipicephalus microplus]
MFRAEMNKRCTLQWSLENSDTELHKWVPDLRLLPSFFPPNKALVTLLTGHGWFHPYFHRFNQMGEPRCFCGGMCENIQHYLTECPDTKYITAQLSPQVMADESNLPRILERAYNRALLIRLVRHISEDIPELSRGRWVRALVSVRVTKRTVAHDIHAQSNTQQQKLGGARRGMHTPRLPCRPYTGEVSNLGGVGVVSTPERASYTRTTNI